MPSDVATQYARRHWRPVPIPLGEKGPRLPGWNRLRIDESQVPAYFDVPGLNVGILLGEASDWLVDVDLDVAEAIELAPDFLPPTRAIFGRASKARSHWLYYSRGARSLKLIGDAPEGEKRPTLVELRSSGLQTVFPGSVHPSGEPIEWHEDGELAHIEADALENAVRMLGEATKLVRAGWDRATAIRIAREGRVDQAPAAKERARTEGTFADAVAAYNRDHRQDWPRSGGDCPGCGHKDCFGRMPGDDSRWYCFSASHTEPGLRGLQGYHGDALDLDAHAAGLTRAEMLRRAGYLSSRPEPVARPESGQASDERPAPKKLRFLKASEYVQAWNELPETVTVPTGISSLDKALGGGLPACQVTQIIGGPGARKSELVRQIRNHVAAVGHHVLHVDAELTIGLLGTRDFSQRAEMASAIVRDRRGWNDLQAEAIREAQGRVGALETLWVLCTPPVPLPQLSEAVGEVVEATKDSQLPRLIILDSLQQLSFGVEAKERRHEVERFIAWANELAKTTGSAVLITSEKKRGNGEDGALHSGAESRSIEFQSAVVIVLEPEGSAEDEIAGAASSRWEQRVRMIVAKNREGQKGKLPDVLVFTGPSWDWRIETAENELAEAVLGQLAEGPKSSGDIATTLKKRRHAIDAVLQWLVDQDSVEKLRVSGRSHKVMFRLRDFQVRSSDERMHFFARPEARTSPDER